MLVILPQTSLKPRSWTASKRRKTAVSQESQEKTSAFHENTHQSQTASHTQTDWIDVEYTEENSWDGTWTQGQPWQLYQKVKGILAPRMMFVDYRA